MTKKALLKIVVVVWCCSLFVFLAGCATTAHSGENTAFSSTPAVTPTPATKHYAATVSFNNTVDRDAEGDNLTTIHSAVDRPVARLTKTTLNVPGKARGEVFIQNDSSNPITVVSDTADTFETFTIAPNSTAVLLFHRAGTFKSHLKDFPISTDTSLTIIITYPYPE